MGRCSVETASVEHGFGSVAAASAKAAGRRHDCWLVSDGCAHGNCVTPIRYNSPMATESSTEPSSSRPHDQDPPRPPPERKCAWCPNTFAVVRRPGRPRVYCSHACRQRAHERRSGLGVVPPPDRLIMQPGGPTDHLPARRLGYEGGIVRYTPNRRHALRPAGRSESGERRLTLCGLLAFPVPNPYYGALGISCKTCAKVEGLRPSARPVRPSPDLAALRLLLDRAAVASSRTARSKHPQRTAEEILAELLEAA